MLETERAELHKSSAFFNQEVESIFEMNEKGIRHIQLKSQFKKNQVMAWIEAFAGAVSGNATASGAGLLAASKGSSYSRFKKVRKIEANRRRHVIYVNESLDRNQVYVSDEEDGLMGRQKRKPDKLFYYQFSLENRV